MSRYETEKDYYKLRRTLEMLLIEYHSLDYFNFTKMYYQSYVLTFKQPQLQRRDGPA